MPRVSLEFSKILGEKTPKAREKSHEYNQHY